MTKNRQIWIALIVAVAIMTLVMAGCVAGGGDPQISPEQTTPGTTSGGLPDNDVFDPNSGDPVKPTKPGSSSNPSGGDIDAPDSSTQPEGTQPGTEDAGAIAPGEMTYAQYRDLPAAKQREYMESFSDLDAFFDWYNAAKEAYEKENPPIEVTGPIDLEDLTK